MFSLVFFVCAFILPDIYFSGAQPLVVVLTMHTRITGVPAALEVHTELLSCYQPLVYNKFSPSQYTTGG